MGWTFDYVDELSLPQIYMLYDYWQQNPPVHVLFAAFAGHKGTRGETYNNVMQSIERINPDSPESGVVDEKNILDINRDFGAAISPGGELFQACLNMGGKVTFIRKEESVEN